MTQSIDRELVILKRKLRRHERIMRVATLVGFVIIAAVFVRLVMGF